MENIGVILVGHGSKEPYNKNAIKYFAEKLKDKYSFVKFAFIQINKPSLKDVLKEAIASGIDKIVVQPVFLTRGTHVNQDIPKILGLPIGVKSGTIALSEKKISIVIGEPLGMDDRIVDIISDRIKEALTY
ncbi:MAG: sirohydrochlorin nickelochelatase [Candidatus Verstraetearchaeota archaeon]|nr:sirohydrochlorin nickelochelatase [Candidatus Verstraetearchaeota archaeon]